MTSKVKTIEVRGQVRFPEDSKYNGKSDTSRRMPGSYSQYWKATIEVETGRVIGWPAGNTAEIFYKVADECDWITRDEIGTVLTFEDGYPPKCFQITSTNSKYLAFDIGPDGLIKDWKY